MMGKDNSFNFLEKFFNINREKYRLLGIKDEELIEKLVKMEASQFTYMFIHRIEIEDKIQRALDKLAAEKDKL